MTRSRTLAGRHVVVVNWRDLDHTLSGGAEIYAWHWARALREGGAEVSFVTSRDRGQTAQETRDGIAIHRGGGTLGFYLFALRWLWQHRRRVDAVIDPACGLPVFSPLVLRRRTPVVLVVHHVHQDQFGTHFPAPVAAFGRWMERVAMPRLYRRRTTVAVSDSTRAQMRDRLGWRGAVRIVENGADLPSYDVRVGVAKDPDRIVVLGRLVSHKRVDVVLDAFARLRRDAALAGRDLLLDVIGQGPDRDRLVAASARLGLTDRVTFHGYLSEDDKGALLARASVHVCASDAEGWGQAVIDAAAWGVPTVARDVPGLRDSIRPGESGWLVPDSTDLAEVGARIADALRAALEAAAAPAERAHRAQVCRSWAEQFDWSRMRREARDLTSALIPSIHLSGRAAAPPEHHHPRASRVAV